MGGDRDPPCNSRVGYTMNLCNSRVGGGNWKNHYNSRVDYGSSHRVDGEHWKKPGIPGWMVKMAFGNPGWMGKLAMGNSIFYPHSPVEIEYY